MPESTVKDVREALAGRLDPSVTLWNRLEGRPRATDFTRALRAEVRDALWFLTRQWQTGELTGDDAGTPVLAKLHLSTTRLTKYRASNAVEPFDDNTPLEAKVERRPLRFTEHGQPVSLDIRLLMGRQWLKLIKPIGAYAADFIREYGIDVPDPTSAADAQYCAHREVWAHVAALAGRSMDGAKLYFYLTGGPNRHAYDHVPAAGADQQRIDKAATKFMKWFDTLFLQPPAGQDDSWEADRMEYQFSASATDAGGDETVYNAQEYYQGHLDWYSVDLAAANSTLGTTTPAPANATSTETQTLIPVPISFSGMPNTRWWAFEDGKTNFGDVQPNTTDVGKLLLMEFGLVYANDWALVPFTLPLGSIASVEGLAVTNVFGERTWIDAAGSGSANQWQRWRMFSVSADAGATSTADSRLLLLPTPTKVLEGQPIEDVALARDEMANMVWAVEQRIPLATGASKLGSEAAIELRSYYQRIVDETVASSPATTPAFQYNANIRFDLMSTVPENWIPFISMKVPGDTRAMQLQRAAMPRILDHDPDLPDRVEPRTMLLRDGLDVTPRRAYFVHEEEVPRAGIRVTQSFQRTRWLNGRVFVWLGARKQTGRGEGSSGLAFDRIVDVKQGETG